MRLSLCCLLSACSPRSEDVAFIGWMIGEEGQGLDDSFSLEFGFVEEVYDDRNALTAYLTIEEGCAVADVGADSAKILDEWGIFPNSSSATLEVGQKTMGLNLEGSRFFNRLEEAPSPGAAILKYRGDERPPKKLGRFPYGMNITGLDPEVPLLSLDEISLSWEEKTNEVLLYVELLDVNEERLQGVICRSPGAERAMRFDPTLFSMQENASTARVSFGVALLSEDTFRLGMSSVAGIHWSRAAFLLD